MYKNFRKLTAFTLAEVLTTISMIGVIAAITIPSVNYHHQRIQNKVRVKKAMADYDSFLRRVVADNFLRTRTNAQLYNTIHDNNCEIVPQYFKLVERNGCTFYTSDGIWWEIVTDNNTLWAKVAFREADLNTITIKSTAYKTGVWFFASFNNGILYVNDTEAAKAIDGVAANNNCGNDEACSANTNLQNFIE